MQKGRAAGAHACNGYAMWLGQAEKNWEIWKKKNWKKWNLVNIEVGLW